MLLKKPLSCTHPPLSLYASRSARSVLFRAQNRPPAMRVDPQVAKSSIISLTAALPSEHSQRNASVQGALQTSILVQFSDISPRPRCSTSSTAPSIGSRTGHSSDSLPKGSSSADRSAPPASAPLDGWRLARLRNGFWGNLYVGRHFKALPLARISQCAMERRLLPTGAKPVQQLSLRLVAARADHGGNDMV